MPADLPNLVAAGAVTTIDGVWQRHVAAPFAASALQGRRGYGRWGTREGFPVLYLGRPLDSVVIEAYRHLIDPVEDEQQAALLAEQLQTRVLVTATLHVSDLLDLRHTGTRAQLGLTLDVLQSGTQDRQAYQACQQVAQVATNWAGTAYSRRPPANAVTRSPYSPTTCPRPSSRDGPRKTNCGHNCRPIPANPPPGPYGSFGIADPIMGPRRISPPAIARELPKPLPLRWPRPGHHPAV